MKKFYVEVLVSDNPDSQELIAFVKETVRLLSFLIQAEDFHERLWRKDENLRQLALKSLNADIIPAASYLESRIPKITNKKLQQHGLIGTAAKFKYAVITKLASRWRRYEGQFTIGKSFKTLIEAIDAVLDSITEAAGSGGLIKEFKDIICALR